MTIPNTPTATTPSPAASGALSSGRDSPRIAEAVVAGIAGPAAREVRGGYALGGGAARIA
ncbi:hypothetical protein [Pseudonocardia sp. ICBG1034]|uniref:hypothetical protein n=1 Tax=Pseudonocardia sp. ICBG1034 TaxID=2844381 RepID=UPI001CCE181B|nr:hypothetical protein [Pseudonocardia sp. ICBG1034]